MIIYLYLEVFSLLLFIGWILRGSGMSHRTVYAETEAGDSHSRRGGTGFIVGKTEKYLMTHSTHFILGFMASDIGEEQNVAPW